MIIASLERPPCFGRPLTGKISTFDRETGMMVLRKAQHVVLREATRDEWVAYWDENLPTTREGRQKFEAGKRKTRDPRLHFYLISVD
jgi:predicted amidohydrolase